ncbi:GNAT family N-acetyltransferase [Litoricolaceae bacterium]|nr:GNAT family N-acetyltransferase [Litorivicinaceae bacterium]
MNPPKQCDVVFSPLSIENLEKISSQIDSQDASQFTALSDLNSISEAMRTADKDRYLQVHTGDDLVGIVLGRGIDEGFEDVRLAIYIVKKYRGRGLGFKIITKFLFNYTDNENFNKFSVKVKKQNSKAILLYKRLGFHVYEESAEDYFLELEV